MYTHENNCAYRNTVTNSNGLQPKNKHSLPLNGEGSLATESQSKDMDNLSVNKYGDRLHIFSMQLIQMLLALKLI